MYRHPLTPAQKRAVAKVTRTLAAVTKAKARRDQAVRDAVTVAGIPPYRLSAELGGGLSTTHVRRVAHNDPLVEGGDLS